MDPKTAIATFFILILQMVSAMGHGRIHTSISADVWEDSARVTINAALIDLMVAGELDYEKTIVLDEEERWEKLRAPAHLMAERLILLDEANRRLAPRAVRVEMPDAGDESSLRPGPDQQHARIVLEYSLSSPPESLLFWQNFGQGKHLDLYPTTHVHSPLDRHDFDPGEMPAIPIQAVLSIRQKGEMVLLPSELGPGFPIRFPFQWDDPIVPLAHRQSLRDATAIGRNRPPNTRLEIGNHEIKWTLFFPLGLLIETMEGNESPMEHSSEEEDWSRLKRRLPHYLHLEIDGRLRRPDSVSVSVHPVSVMAVLHDRRLPPGADQPGWVVVAARMKLDAPPGQIKASWSLFGPKFLEIPGGILVSGNLVDFQVMTRANPRLAWERR